MKKHEGQICFTQEKHHLILAFQSGRPEVYAPKLISPKFLSSKAIGSAEDRKGD